MAKTGKPLGNMIINLGLNDSAFKKGLQGSKQQTRHWMSEMKASMRVMDLAGDKTGKLKVRQEGLTKVIETQKKEVEQLTKRYKESYDEQGNATSKTADYAREVNNAVAKLAGYETQLKKVSRELAISESKMIKFGDSVVSTGGKMQRFGGKMSGVGKSLTKNITKPALAAVSALVGITLVKGFQRLKGIDEARAKLMGLGHDAKDIEKIMKSALKSVEGTSFGMDEAATSAAGAVAAGIKPGKELTKYLKTAGDAAAIAGVGLGEMGSIFNKVTTGQKAYTQELNQLSDKGIPIFQYLADEMGIAGEDAAGAVKKMASEGKISAEDFMNAIEKNIGGAALIMGQTSFTAAVSNMWSAVSRLGSAFLDANGEGGGMFSTLKPLMAKFTEKIDNMGDAAAELGVKFGNALIRAIEKIKEWKKGWDNLTDGQKDFVKQLGLSLLVAGPAMQIVGGIISKFGELFLFIGKGIKAFGKLKVAIELAGGLMPWLSGLLAAVNWPLVLIVGAVVALGVAFQQAYTKIEPFKLFVDGLIESFIKFSVELYENYIKPAVDEIVLAFQVFLYNLKAFWKENGEQILNSLRVFFGFIWAILQPALGFWTGIFKSTFTTIVNLVKNSWQTIRGVFSGAFKIIGGLIKVFSGVFTGDWGKMWEGVKDIASGGWNIIASGIEGFANAVLSVIEGLARGMQKGIVGAVNGVIKAVSWILKKFGLDGIKEWKIKEIKVGRVTLPKFATGSKGLPFDTLGVVNDQKGSNYEEMIVPKKGRPFIPKGRDVVLPMSAGTQIIPAKLTKQYKENLPHFEKGFFGNVWEGTKNTASKLWGNVKKFSGDIWDYMSDPKELVQLAVNKFTHIPELPSFWLDMAHGAVKHTSNKAVGFVKDKFDEMFESGDEGDDSKDSNGVYSFMMRNANLIAKKFGMSYTSGYRAGDPYDHGKGLAVDIALPSSQYGSPIYTKAANEAIKLPGMKYVITNGRWKHKGQDWKIWPEGDHYDHLHLSGNKPSPGSSSGSKPKGGNWAAQIRRAAGILGQSVSGSEVSGLLAQIQRESGGDQNVTQNSAVWDVNMANGNPAQGLLQYIPSTFNNYKLRGFGNIKNGYHQLLAFFNNSNWRRDLPYGRRGWSPTGRRIRGYENGGLVKKHQIAQIAEGNKPEMVIPLTKKSRAVELINKAKAIIGMSDGSVVVNNDNDHLEKLIEKQNSTIDDLGDKMIALLSIIAGKDLNIDGKKMYKNQSKHGGQDLKSLRFQGGGF